MSDDVALPLEFTEAAANKVKHLIADEDNPNLKLRVYITGATKSLSSKAATTAMPTACW